jgi:hypothetical protein
MKRLILLALIFCSCSVTNYPLKGSYPNTPMVFASNNTFENTWDKLIDVFAQKGLSIRLIDKSSGLIISTTSAMPASAEDEKGRLVDRSAYIAVPSWRFGGGQRQAISGQVSTGYNKNSKAKFREVYGEWNVRVKPSRDGSTINVNITNVNYYEYDQKTKTKIFLPLTDYHSTGVFEKLLSDMIK